MSLRHVLSLLTDLEAQGLAGAVVQHVSMADPVTVELRLVLHAPEAGDTRTRLLDAIAAGDEPTPAEKPAARKRAAKKKA